MNDDGPDPRRGRRAGRQGPDDQGHAGGRRPTPTRPARSSAPRRSPSGWRRCPRRRRTSRSSGTTPTRSTTSPTTRPRRRLVSLALCPGHPHRPSVRSTSKITYAGAGWRSGRLDRDRRWSSATWARARSAPTSSTSSARGFFGSPQRRDHMVDTASSSRRSSPRCRAILSSGSAGWHRDLDRAAGGYFISLDVLHGTAARWSSWPGCRVALTPAASAFPYGRRPARPQHPADLPTFSGEGRGGRGAGRGVRLAGLPAALLRARRTTTWSKA